MYHCRFISYITMQCGISRCCPASLKPESLILTLNDFMELFLMHTDIIKKQTLGHKLYKTSTQHTLLLQHAVVKYMWEINKALRNVFKMRMVQAHGGEEHVNKWWKRTDVCCLDTQAACLREVWIIELTRQRYIVCSHLNHKRFCACCVVFLLLL